MSAVPISTGCPASRTARRGTEAANQKQELALAWLESLMIPAQQLAQCLSVQARVPPPGERTAVHPVVRVQLPGSNAAPLEFADVLLGVMHLLVSDHAKYVSVSASMSRTHSS